jgi:hypothetical protein
MFEHVESSKQMSAKCCSCCVCVCVCERVCMLQHVTREIDSNKQRYPCRFCVSQVAHVVCVCVCM